MIVKEKRPYAEVLDRIALRGSTPLERVHYGWITETSTAGPQAQARLQQLYDLVGSRDEEMQAQLLHHFSLSREQLACALAPSQDGPLTSRPSWVATLEQIVQEEHYRCQRQEDPRQQWQDPCLQSEEPHQPFEEFFLPFIRYARTQLHSRLDGDTVPVSPAVHCQLEHWLLRQLFGLGGQVLYTKFTDVRLHHPVWEERLNADTSSRRVYEEFLARYQGEGMLSLFLEYSVLAHYLVQQTEQWIEAVYEFCQRLANDYEQIKTSFWPQQPQVGMVVAITPGCSDPHQQGRSVFLLTFAAGCQLVYKPHDLQIDVSFETLLVWMNEQGLSPTLRGAGALNRSGYGWMEYIDHRGCTTPEEVHRYFHRAGQFLCLFYLLQSTDMHYENLIAQADAPIPIDIETLFTPPIRSLWSKTAFPRPEWQQRDASVYSVYQSTMLPLKLTIQESSLDLSFLGCVSAFASPYTMVIWDQVNTDQMQQVSRPGSIPAAKNALFLDGILQNATSYIEPLLTGFALMYRFLMKQRAAFLAEDGPLAAFHECSGRYILRSTYLYEKQLKRLTHPFFLHESVKGWIDMQVFLRPLLKHQASPQLWKAMEAEIAAIQRRDVPRFEIDPTSVDLFTDTGMRIENVFTLSAIAHARQCLQQFSEADMARQMTLIREALFPPSEAHEEMLERKDVGVTIGLVEGEER